MTVEAQIAAYEQRLRELVPGVGAGRRELFCEGGCGKLMRTYIDHPMCHPCRREKPPKPKPERTEADRAAGRARYAAGYRQPGRSKLCAGGCGKLLSWSPERGSRDEPTCQECRRAARQRVCEQCGRTFEAKDARFPNKTCGIKCRGAARALPAGEADARGRAASRYRKAVRRRTGDGVTNEEIAEQDGWECQIPVCLFPSRQIPRSVAWTHEQALEVDHIVPIGQRFQGPDIAANKRAAHRACNGRRGGKMTRAKLLAELRQLPADRRLAIEAAMKRAAPAGQG